ncbi:hypothetical protein AMES_2889 [Amycolatopsis mediterranei S699]|uniref:Uncharacterized protein n=2 Tax=Amycolatopsis mediterranei TaxID=33910 RepID=A0A0H3D1A6_AMYMU|nr:DUF6338 family protein [Amycolatopsis mediterranei]ADJ44714.1 conserved hypothetical protein [Amycolatopsis mediterranei U32]AEK41457.1 hypothetical protein RAM_14845 [Amycolatopsis mediterranei S699]AFO76425.1 hypothetical protein AMES_2889 [Amycolatopsis mediterranei S699]AGT83554.1 hypothetical protein B737_2890 [Amycolatopsis mediterranei RB]KDO07463.1 hypothetical protein DV26_29695 [Amycolatopsis mediterranei]
MSKVAGEWWSNWEVVTAIPSTMQQVAILVILVLPGVFYQAVRDRLKGPLAAEREPGNRLLRVMAVSALLDVCYALVAGPWLVEMAVGNGPGPLSGVAHHPRTAGLIALLLVVAVPTGLAWAEAALVRRRGRPVYDPVPTAWDALFRRRSSCFVRVRTKSGAWVGGWYGRNSFAAAYPQTADLFLESQYRLTADGTFLEKMPATGGVYISGAEVEVLEILEREQVHDERER